MPLSFVDGLADAIVRQLFAEDGATISTASSRGAAFRRSGGHDAFANLDRRGVARVASAIAGRMTQAQSQELPLEAIEI